MRGGRKVRKKGIGKWESEEKSRGKWERKIDRKGVKNEGREESEG